MFLCLVRNIQEHNVFSTKCFYGAIPDENYSIIVCSNGSKVACPQARDLRGACVIKCDSNMEDVHIPMSPAGRPDSCCI